MRCCSCLRNIAAGVEAQKMIVEYQQADDSSKIFGYLMSDGPLTAATGRMVRGWHHKCYHVARKRAARGDVVTGRVVAGTPTAYDVEAMDGQLVHLTAKLHRMREVAARLGKGVGDAQVQEAWLAEEHGGPYDHEHSHRLDTYQLLAHMEYAHGYRDARLFRSGGGLQDAHLQLHAAHALAAVRARRAGQPDEDRPERDWREQFTADIE